MFISGVLLDGAQWSNVETREAEHPLGTFDRSEQTNFSVNGHQLRSGDLVAAHGLVGTEHEPVLVQLRPEQLLGDVLPVGQVGGAAGGAGQQRPTHLPAAAANQVRVVTPVQRRAGRGLATHDTHQE